MTVEGKPYLTAAFDSSPVTLGALAHNDVVLNDPFVSGEHAEVILSRGSLVFRDKSTNGSYLEGRRIEEENLGTGATVSIPPYEVELAFEEDETAWQTSFRTDIAGMVAAARPRPEEETTVSREADDMPARADLDATTPAAEPKPAPRVTPLPHPVVPPSAPSAATKPTLLVKKAPEDLDVHEFVLTGEARIGRGENADVRLPIGSVSRWHAAVRPTDDGGYVVVDLGSSNGTFVNGERVQEGRLRHDDEITVGEVVLAFVHEPTELEPTELKPSLPPPPPIPREPTPVPAPTRIAEAPTPGTAPAPPSPAPPAPAPPSPAPPSTPVPFGISIQRAEGPVPIHVAIIQGRIDGYSYTQLSDALDQAIEEGVRHMVIDLSRVDYVTHAGLGVFVKCLTRLRRQRGDLRLAGLNDRIKDAFSLSRLDSLFRGRLAASRDEALRAWNKNV